MGSCSNLDLDVVPGLPNELVASRILPLLPWYARPVCRAISTSWKSLIDAARNDPVLIDATRAAQIPLLRGAVVLCFKSNHGTVLKFVDRFHNRDLPPFSELPPDRLAWSGRIFVWAGWSLTRYHIFKLDVGRGDWHWQQVTTPISSDWFNPIVLGSKIYPIVLGSKIYVSSPKQLDVAVFDMESYEFEKIPMWDCSDVGSVVVSQLGVEDLYGFRDRPARVVEVLRYNRSSNSWSTQERITRPPRVWWSLMVVNGSCFEPAIETGTNVLCWELYKKPLGWHNSTVCNDDEWIPIQCEALTMVVRRGSLYGWDIDRKTLCKGKIVVESKHLIWEPLVYVSDGLLNFTTLA